ncbi:MAG: thiamine-phosphate kinase [Bacteroidota bacterium]
MVKKEKSGPFTSLQELGLDGFMNRINTRPSKISPVVRSRMGDRVQIRELSDTVESVVTTQSSFIDSIHFDLSYTPLPHLGSKWVTAISTRLLACGVLPDQLLVSLAVPNMISAEMIDSILEGMDRHPVGASVKITEVAPSRTHLTAAITGMGLQRKGELLVREESTKGDLLCVTGDVGGAMAGLRILLREKKYWDPKDGDHFEPDLSGYEHVIGKQLLPVTRLDLMDGIRDSGVKPGSMIDLSQGLMNDLQILGQELSCGFNIYSPAIPIDLVTRKVADEMKEDVDRYALYGGEDHELLFTLREGDVEKLRASFEDFTVIGEVTEEKDEIVVNDGEGGTVDPSTDR